MTILDVNNNSFYNQFEYNIENAVEALKKEFGQQFSISKSVREQHTSTTTVHTPELPDGVVFAYTKEDVQKTVKICHEYGCPIIPFGAGSSLEGHLNANFGGISIDMNNLNNIIVSWFYTGWVFIIDLDQNDSNKFYCRTYKIGVDPSKIKKELYNYTKNNGTLINVTTVCD